MIASAYQDLFQLFLYIFIGLFLVSILSYGAKRSVLYQGHQKLIDEVITRTNAWWVMTLVFFLALSFGLYSTLLLFLFISVVAFREYTSLSSTTAGDRRVLFWSFIVICPFQYYLIAINWYGLYSIFIPVYAFLFLAARAALCGETEDFLSRIAKTHWGLMASVYFISYVPALLTLDIPRFHGRDFQLLFYLVFLTELSDILQFVFGKAFGKHQVAPTVSPRKTIEGLLGGILSTCAVGYIFYFITPFTPIQSAVAALVITFSGFLGGLTMAAIKRDHGVKDYSAMISGHGGMMDRIDSLCFSAPIFFHLLRYFFTV